MAKNPLFTWSKPDRECLKKAMVPTNGDFGHAICKIGRGIKLVLRAAGSPDDKRYGRPK